MQVLRLQSLISLGDILPYLVTSDTFNSVFFQNWHKGFSLFCLKIKQLALTIWGSTHPFAR